MATKTDAYLCTECGWTSVRWVGRCSECQTWGSVVERGAPKLQSVTTAVPEQAAIPIGEVDIQAAQRTLTGIGELDRVLGGGLVPGAVVLLAGEPGVGKSTLLLEVAAHWARAGMKTLYVSGEESAAQVRLRAQRTNSVDDELYLAAETDLGTVLGHIEQTAPSLLVVDSVQTIGTAQADGSVGGVSQIREVTGALVRVAKRRGMAVIIIGHVTKDGQVAGPRLLEHLVDVVLSFEGDRNSGFRMVRANKNRFGPADEVGCFEMGEHGIVEVPDPSGLFTSRHEQPVPGTCVTVTREGTRYMMAEVQSLVAKAAAETPPRRVTHGVDGQRIAMIVAVMQRRAHFPLSHQDIYASTIGGARIMDPAADLALAIAIASAALDESYLHKVVALGEIGLAGDLRRVPSLEQRVGEAARMGFELALVPSGNRDPHSRLPRMHGMKVVEVSTVSDALVVLGLRHRSKERKQSTAHT